MMRRSFLRFSGAFCALEDVTMRRDWDFAAPTLTMRSRFTRREPWATNTADLVAHLDAKYPPLGEIMASGGLALKGGAFASLLMGRSPSDLDLYVVGEPERNQRACDRVGSALQSIVNLTMNRALDTVNREIEGHRNTVDKKGGVHLSKEEVEQKKRDAVNAAVGKLFAVRRGGVITITGIPAVDIPIQISLSPFRTLEECASDGDVDAGAVAMSIEEGMKISQRAKWALQNWSIRATTTDGGPVVGPKRIMSYFERGFDIVLPAFDLSKVHRRNPRLGIPTTFDICNGHLVVEVEGDLDGNKIQVSSIKPRVQRALYHGSPLEVVRNSLTESMQPAASGCTESSLKRVMLQDDSPSSVRFLRGGNGKRNVNPRSLAIKAMNHNVQQLLNGKTDNFHVVAYGREIFRLADVRFPPVAKRHVEGVLGHVLRQVEKDPLGSKSLVEFAKFFPACNPVEAVQNLLPPADSKEAFSDFVKKELQKMKDLQLKEAQKMLTSCEDALRSCELTQLLPTHDQHTFQCAVADYYGMYAAKDNSAESIVQ